MLCFAHEEEEEKPRLSLSNSCRFIPSLIRKACAQCHVSSCLKSPSSSSFDPEEEALSDSDLNNKHVIILEIRNRAKKAKTRPNDYLLRKLLIAPKEERVDIGKEGGGDDDVQSEVFYSVKSCFSRCCSSEKELDYFSHSRGQSVLDEFTHCEGWPFGLCKKPLMMPPLPSSPSDSWTWRKNLSKKACAST